MIFNTFKSCGEQQLENNIGIACGVSGTHFYSRMFPAGGVRYSYKLRMIFKGPVYILRGKVFAETLIGVCNGIKKASYFAYSV